MPLPQRHDAEPFTKQVPAAAGVSCHPSCETKPTRREERWLRGPLSEGQTTSSGERRQGGLLREGEGALPTLTTNPRRWQCPYLGAHLCLRKRSHHCNHCAPASWLGLSSCPPGCPGGRDCLPGRGAGLQSVIQASRGMLAGQWTCPRAPMTLWPHL